MVIEDVSIENVAGPGIIDTRTTGGNLVITNTLARNNTGTGVVINAASGSAPINAVLIGVHSDHNGFGLAADSAANVVARHSSFSDNTNPGVDAESGAGGARAVLLDDCIVSNNPTGFEQVGSGSIRAANSDFAFNGVLGIGTLQSFTNSRFVNNGAGGTISPIGATSNPTGQQ